MHKEVKFIHEAQREFIDIVDHYEQIYSYLGLAFKKEVKKVIDLMTLFPDLCSKHQDGPQRMSIHRFPYQVIFFLFQNTLWIVSVAAGVAKFLSWQSGKEVQLYFMYITTYINSIF